jgi:hypothetical protein
MMESFVYKSWFDIKPIRTSDGEIEMKHGETYEIEKLRVRNGRDHVYKIRGGFNGDDAWRTSSLIVSQRIYELLEAYANAPEFIKIR